MERKEQIKKILKKELVRELNLDCVKTLVTGWLLMELNEMDN